MSPGMYPWVFEDPWRPARLAAGSACLAETWTRGWTSLASVLLAKTQEMPQSDN